MFYYILTQPEFGFKKVQLEYPISDMIAADLFVPEKNLIIQIDGPCHFFNSQEGQPKVPYPSIIKR